MEDQPGICHATFPYSALLHQQLLNHLWNTLSAPPCQGQQILRACTPPYLLQPFVPINCPLSRQPHQLPTPRATQSGNTVATTMGTAEEYSLMPPSLSQIPCCCLRLCRTAKRAAGPGGHRVSRGEGKARQHQRCCESRSPPRWATGE